jgi:hypothetical protein
VTYEKELPEGANMKPPRQILPLGAFEFQVILISLKKLILPNRKEFFYEKYDLLFSHFINGFSMRSGQSAGAPRAL